MDIDKGTLPALTNVTLMPIPTFLAPFFRLVTTLFNRHSDRKTRRANACAAFRESIHRELQGLYPHPTAWPPGPGIDQRLRSVFPALQSAVSIFRPYLSKRQQQQFDEAWLYYRTATKREIDAQSYTHYMNFTTTSVSAYGGLTNLKQDGKETFRRNVDRLLSFAQDV